MLTADEGVRHDMEAPVNAMIRKVSEDYARMKYNTAIKTFPAVLFAGVMGFKERPSFTAEEGASAAPKVTF